MNRLTRFLTFFLLLAVPAAHAQSMAEMAVVGQASGTLTTNAVAAKPMDTMNDAMARPEGDPATAPIVTPQPPSVTATVTQTPIAPETKTMDSIFFTPNQLIAITRANQGFIAPQEAYDPDNQSSKPIDPGPRIISLSGIVFNSKSDWTIWLNNERVTPKNIPDRIMGLSVRKDRVFIRWMDLGNQRIVNIVLRPNQQYLLDSDQIILGTR
jgi:hypothetical protein